MATLLQRLDDETATGRVAPAARAGGATTIRIVAASAIDDALRRAWDDLADDAA